MLEYLGERDAAPAIVRAMTHETGDAVRAALHDSHAERRRTP